MSLVTTKEPANSFEDDYCLGQPARRVAVKYETETLGSNFQIAPQCRIESFDFKMWVNPPATHDQRHEALHVCTALPHDAQRAATPLEHIANWRSLYPDLAPLSEDAGFDCNLVFMESKLDLMTDSPPTGSRLGIDFFARIGNGSAYEVWNYNTVFYEKGRRVHDCSGELRSSVEDSSECVGTTKLEMSLESSWWVKLFFKISERRRVREARGDLDALQQVDETTRRSLKEMSVMQEIWGTSYANRLPRKRVAVVLWKFRQVRPNEPATTRWRDLIPPPSRITTYSPAPPILASQMTFDSSIDSHMHQPVAIYTDPFQQQLLDNFAHCPDPSSTVRASDNYRTSSDAGSGPSGTMDYSVSNVDVKQADLGAVDFTEGHIDLYCQSYSQPPPAYDGHTQFVASDEGMPEGFDDDEWAAMCAHPGIADVVFEHGNVPQVDDMSNHEVGNFADVGFEHADLPDVPVKLEHDSDDVPVAGFRHDHTAQVANRSVHGVEDFTDVGFEHANVLDVSQRPEHHSEDFIDVGFQQETISQVADSTEHDSHRFTYVHSQYENFTQALQNAGHENEQFADGSFEHVIVPDFSEKSSHANDAFTDVGFEHAHSPEVPEVPSHGADVFTDVGFEHANLPAVPEKLSHGTDVFTDVGFEHADLPDRTRVPQHDNDSDYEHIRVQDFAMSFD